MAPDCYAFATPLMRYMLLPLPVFFSPLCLISLPDAYAMLMLLSLLAFAPCY